MTTDIDAICNLSDDDREARRKEIEEELLPKVRTRESLPNGIALSFLANSENRRDLDAFVAFERECCPGLDFDLRNADDSLRLEITRITHGSRLFVGVPEAVGPANPSRAGWWRLLSSAGLGTLGALIICCVLPLVVIALLGTAAAAPLTSLDHAWIISGSALLLAAVIWQRQRRRGRIRSASASTEGCGC
jgi:hypothetical protein